jgi:hypothetical protein
MPKTLVGSAAVLLLSFVLIRLAYAVRWLLDCIDFHSDSEFSKEIVNRLRFFPDGSTFCLTLR